MYYRTSNVEQTNESPTINCRQIVYLAVKLSQRLESATHTLHSPCQVDGTVTLQFGDAVDRTSEHHPTIRSLAVRHSLGFVLRIRVRV